MKIHSKYSDYYDSALAFGVDETVHWVRNVAELKMTLGNSGYYAGSKVPGMHPFFDTDMFKTAPKHYGAWQSNKVDRKTIFVGVCGKVWPAIQFSWTNKDYTHVYRTAYNVEQVKKILAEHDRKFKTKELKGFKSDRSGKKSYSGRAQFNEYDLNNFFNTFQAQDHIQLFVDLKVPLFVIDPAADDGNHGILYTNPEMKQYDFQKVLGSYLMYQEIEMFMSGVLGTGNPEMVEIEDKYKIAGHGYTKCSFRKAPTKRKNQCTMKSKK